MKKEKTVLFENKKLGSKRFEEKFTYCNMAIYVFNSPPPQGINMVQMVERIDAIKLFRINEDVEITQANLNELIRAFDSINNWNFVDEKIPEFHNYIKGLKEKF